MPSSWVCVDASLIVHLVADPEDTQALPLWRGWEESGHRPAAPTLAMFEVANALYRLEKQRILSASSVDASLQAALSLAINLYSDALLHRQALEIARRFQLPATYDAHYLALAERLGANFWTYDRRLAAAVTPRLPWVHLVSALP
jgi:predicted nucleic acid-binding protein